MRLCNCALLRCLPLTHACPAHTVHAAMVVVGLRLCLRGAVGRLLHVGDQPAAAGGDCLHGRAVHPVVPAVGRHLAQRVLVRLSWP